MATIRAAFTPEEFKLRTRHASPELCIILNVVYDIIIVHVVIQSLYVCLGPLVLGILVRILLNGGTSHLTAVVVRLVIRGHGV